MTKFLLIHLFSLAVLLNALAGDDSDDEGDLGRSKAIKRKAEDDGNRPLKKHEFDPRDDIRDLQVFFTAKLPAIDMQQGLQHILEQNDTLNTRNQYNPAGSEAVVLYSPDQDQADGSKPVSAVPENVGADNQEQDMELSDDEGDLEKSRMSEDLTENPQNQKDFLADMTDALTATTDFLKGFNASTSRKVISLRTKKSFTQGLDFIIFSKMMESKKYSRKQILNATYPKDHQFVSYIADLKRKHRSQVKTFEQVQAKRIKARYKTISNNIKRSQGMKVLFESFPLIKEAFLNKQ